MVGGTDGVSRLRVARDVETFVWGYRRRNLSSVFLKLHLKNKLQ